MTRLPRPVPTRPGERRRRRHAFDVEHVFALGYRCGQLAERRRRDHALARLADAVRTGTLDQLCAELFAEEVEAWLRDGGAER